MSREHKTVPWNYLKTEHLEKVGPIIASITPLIGRISELINTATDSLSKESILIGVLIPTLALIDPLAAIIFACFVFNVWCYPKIMIGLIIVYIATPLLSEINSLIAPILMSVWPL